MASSSHVQARYNAAGQGHVLAFVDQLTVAEKENLLAQLTGIEVEKLAYLVQAAQDEAASLGGRTDDIEPFESSVGRSSDEKSADVWKQKGYEALRQGKVAALVLAGGQGTRLGFEGPKGAYPSLGLPSGSTLFQIISERLKKLSLLCSENQVDRTADIPFYIMTSPLNHQETIQFFEDHMCFGLAKASVFFFQQGMLPCVTEDGKIIMESAGIVSMAPDGNGGIYPSMAASGALSDMKARGVEYVHVFSIDNALVKPADPVFIGFCISENADCGNKVVWKAHAHEKVGVVAKRKGKPCIVEYSEITTEMAERTDDQGRLVFGAGNICNHFYTVDFIENKVLPNMGNMYHIARKKIPYYDAEKQETVTPDSNNGIKLESFIFDVFPLSERMAVLDVMRSEEFAPVKNAPGTDSDSPDTARAMISDLAKKWVVAAGGKLTGDFDHVICEISPLTSYGGEGLEVLVKDREISCPFSL